MKLFKILIPIFVLFFSTQSFAFLFGISSVENATCEDIEKEAKGQVLKNMFGAEFTILQVKNSKELSRTKNKLVCLGDLKLDNGTESKLRMELYEEDGQLWFNYEQEIGNSLNNNSGNEELLVSRSTLKEKILNCKKISNNNDRLLCFDEMSQNIKTADTIMIPSIEKLFAENSLQIGGPNKPFYGCLIDIKFNEEQRDTLTDEIVVPGTIYEVSIGNVNNYLSTYIEEFAYLTQNDENVPKIGDCFAFTLDAPITDQPYFGWANGWGKIYQGNDFVVDEEVKIKPLLDEITVEQFLNDNVSYGSKRIKLTGIVTGINNLSAASFMDENIHFELSSPSHKNSLMLNNAYVVDTVYFAEKWKNSDAIKNKLKSINIGDTITVDGFFDKKNVMGATHGFKIIEIIYSQDQVQKEEENTLVGNNQNENLTNNFPLFVDLKGRTYLDGCGYPNAKYTIKEDFEYELTWHCPETSDTTKFIGQWTNLSNGENLIENISTTYSVEGFEYTDFINLKEEFAEISWNGGIYYIFDYQ